MTDYNDGKIHGWNGGECPVHPKTVVEIRYWTGVRWSREAEKCHWPSMRGCFRVVTPYRDPREFWAFCGALHHSSENAEAVKAVLVEKHPHLGYADTPIIKLVEVME